MSVIYRALCNIGDKVVYPVLPAFAKPAWNHAAGPKTVFFWAPTIKWALVGAGLADLARPAEKLSVSQNIALAATGMIWTRYCLVIKPINYYLSSVNFFVGCTGLAQLGRIAHYRHNHPEATLETPKTEIPVAAAVEVPVSATTMMMNGKNISDGVLQLNFMRPSLNARATEERKKNKKQTDDPIKVYPTVLGPNDEAVPGLDGVVKEERFTRIEQLGFGRFSFHGQNPEVEKIRGVGSRKRKLSECDDQEEGEIKEEDTEPETKIPRKVAEDQKSTPYRSALNGSSRPYNNRGRGRRGRR